MTGNFIQLLSTNTLRDALSLFKSYTDVKSILILNEYKQPINLFLQSEILQLLYEEVNLNTKLYEVAIIKPHLVSEEENISDYNDEVLSQSVIINKDKTVFGIVDLEKYRYFKGLYHKGYLDDISRLFIEGFIITNVKGKILKCCDSLIAMLNLSEDNTVRISDIFVDLDIEQINNYKIVEGIIKYKDIKLIMRILPIEYENEKVAYLFIVEEISRKANLLKNIREWQGHIYEQEAIIDSSYDGIYITDRNGLTLMINSAYERLTGTKRDEMLGQYVEDLVAKGIISDSVTRRVAKTKKAVSIIQKVKNGKNLAITGNPIFNLSGEVDKVVTNVRDITELTSIYEQLERAKALTQRYEEELQKGKEGLIIKSEVMIKLLKKVYTVSKFDSTILLLGESGVGKEVIATTIHENSNRSSKPIIKINCGAIPENLLESELFGFEAGAFTGANKAKPGLFELAHEGTLFLDEIGEMPLNLQVKLLRVLQEQEIVPIGSIKSKKVDVRIIAATNKDINQLVLNGTFREDLYYRLNVVPIEIPPLRERKDDIQILALYFLKVFNDKYNMQKYLDSKVIDLFTEYEWPGNIRELKNIIERIVVCSSSDRITVNEIPNNTKNISESNESITLKGIIPLKKAVEEVESKLFMKAYERYKTTNEIAEILDISQPTASRKMRKYLLNIQ